MAKVKPPFRVLFSNDSTNIQSCTSPDHEKGEPFRPDMLEATVDETAGTGVQVHMLQPATGWVPWWQSNLSRGGAPALVGGMVRRGPRARRRHSRLGPRA